MRRRLRNTWRALPGRDSPDVANRRLGTRSGPRPKRKSSTSQSPVPISRELARKKPFSPSSCSGRARKRIILCVIIIILCECMCVCVLDDRNSNNSNNNRPPPIYVPTYVACSVRPHGRARVTYKDNHLFGLFSYIDLRRRRKNKTDYH